MVTHKLIFKKIIVLLIILLLLLLTTLNGFNFYKLLTVHPEQPVQHTPAITLKPGVNNIPPPKIISQWHLMGEKKSRPIKVPKTSLRLNLIGIISSTIDGQARAIIEISPRKQQYFKVGDEIKANVNIMTINADHIVINHNSREEIVSLKYLKQATPILKKVVIK